MRWLPLFAALASATAVADSESHRPGPQPDQVFGKRPNILFLMADQFRHDALVPSVAPNLAALGRDGASFERAYSSTPICVPARAAVLTGRSPWRHGLVGMGHDSMANIAHRYDVQLPEAMGKLGYATATLGKTHFGWLGGWGRTVDEPVTHGYHFARVHDDLGTGFPNGTEYDDYQRWFQVWHPGLDPDAGCGDLCWRGHTYAYDEWYHPTAWTGRWALSKLQEFSKSRSPFFLKVSFHRPHSPYDPPRRVLESISSDPPLPTRAKDGWDSVFANCYQKGSETAFCGDVDPEEALLARRAYLASVAFVDEWVGTILRALADLGMRERTFILFTSDHGDMLQDHFLWQKGYAYEGSSRIPLAMWWPQSMEDRFSSFRRGRGVSAVAELRDVFPTFLDVAGAWDESWSRSMDGRPLTWWLRPEPPASWREYIDLELEFNPGFDQEPGNGDIPPNWNALTDGRMKFVYLAGTGQYQLFNLTADPSESADLAHERSHQRELEMWRQRMVDQFEEEQRGTAYVKDGALQIRPGGCIYSPNYPEPPSYLRCFNRGSPREQQDWDKLHMLYE